MPTLSRISRCLAATLTTTALLLAGCSDGEAEPAASESPTELLTRAKGALDGASSVHFKLTSQEVPPGGTRLVGGEGFAARPAAFKGTLSVLLNGGTVSVELVSVGGTVYAKLPFAATFARTKPEDFGLTDPALLINPDTGLSRLASEMSGATRKGEARVDGEVVVEVHGQVPGKVIDETLTSADPSKPVEAKVFIVKGSGQLRRAVLTGPFFEPGKNSTFTLVLDRYDEKVSISAPPGV